MVVKLLSVNGVEDSRIVKYIVDTENEKDNIPEKDKIQGTEALVIEGNISYRMNSNKEWIEIIETQGNGVAPSIKVEPLSININGKITAPNGKAYSPITVNVPQSTDLEVPELDVNFIDYDGTILYSYTATEFANLDELPANPTHEGLIAQGWNWTLSNAKAQVANSGMLTIGQNYTTSDGATRIKIKLEEGKLSPYLHLWVTEGVEVTIDWGDDSSIDTIVGLGGPGFEESIFTLHNYQTPGEYTISINSEENGVVTFGAWGNGALLLSNTEFKTSLSQDSYYVSAIKEINLSPVCTISGLMCDAMENLEKISLPNNAEIYDSYEQFGLCYSLKGIVLPLNMEKIYDYMFVNCVNLTRIAIPYQITSYGNKAFTSCHLLKKMAIVDNVTTIGTECFKNCEALEKIYIPSSVTSYPTSFLEYTFSLSSLTIGSNVTSLGSLSLASSSFGELHFKSTSPPVAADSKVFTRLLPECIIYVPTGRRTTYMSATNYPNSNEYTYVEEA